MIKKIQLELLIFLLLMISIFLTYKIDLSFNSFFQNINYGENSTYLKKFFIGITNLGDSLWYFSIFLLIFLISFVAQKIKLIPIEVFFYLRRLCLFSVSYLFLVGVATQIIKHIIGRPRPNHSLLDGSFEFNFFTTDSAFHSFPSGHSSTIIAVIIIASLIIPSLRYFFYTCGFLIAISRVVVGAHFITDVVAGALIAILVYKVFDFLVNKHPYIYWKDLKIYRISTLTKTIIVFFSLAIFVTVGPEVDIYISSLFYYDNNQFLLQSYYLSSIFFRKILLPLIILYIFLFPIISKFLPLKKFYFDYRFSFSDIFFIWFSGLFALIFVVNILLKNMWGRVRPGDISSFGGNDVFTPWYKIGESCISNCSFVSGDASVGFLLIIFYFITKKNIYIYLGTALGSLLGIIRIVAGGHFFSDVIFSQITVTLSILVFFILFRKLYDK